MPRQKAQRYQPCQVLELTPAFLDEYPAYTRQQQDAIDECNQRNELISDHNEAL